MSGNERIFEKSRKSERESLYRRGVISPVSIATHTPVYVFPEFLPRCLFGFEREKKRKVCRTSEEGFFWVRLVRELSIVKLFC